MNNKPEYTLKSTDDLKNVKVLIVEDDDINQEVIKLFLKNVVDFDLVASSEEAIQKVNEESYSLILMDIGLCRVSGLETAKQIKNCPKHKNIPIVAITAHAMQTDVERFLSEGLDFFLAKPYERAELIGIIRKALKLES